MRILIANVTLATRTGTETAARDLALGLQAAGHQPMLYSRTLGDIAREIRARGIPVVSDLHCLLDAPDIIHGNHHIEMMEALLTFRDCPGLFVCHDRTAVWSAPPRIGRIRRYVAVDHNCLERLTDEYGLPAHQTHVIFNAVDMERFVQRSRLPTHPRRALVFSNYAGENTHLEALRDACATENIELDVIGAGVGRSIAHPEDSLGDYDVVFAKARCAIEAMACGTAVVLCDANGLGPLVSVSNVEQLRLWNFGRRLLREPLDPEVVIRQLRRYDADDAWSVSQYIRHHASLPISVGQYLQLYTEILSEEPARRTAAFEDLREYLTNTAIRIADLADERARFMRGQRMEPLSDAECGQVGIEVAVCPDTVVSDETFRVRVEVRNTGSRALDSHPPCPVHLTYRWISTGAGDALMSDGLRTPLRPPAAPGTANAYAMGVKAPTEIGRFRLRLTLVQESVTWFDTLECPVFTELEVEVMPRPESHSPTARQTP